MNEVEETLSIYVDAIRALYQNKDEIILWARNHSDKANTAEPLAEMEDLVKRTMAIAKRNRDVDSMQLVDQALYEMEQVLEVLKLAHQLEKELEAGWEQGKINFTKEAV